PVRSRSATRIVNSPEGRWSAAVPLTLTLPVSFQFEDSWNVEVVRGALARFSTRASMGASTTRTGGFGAASSNSTRPFESSTRRTAQRNGALVDVLLEVSLGAAGGTSLVRLS